MEEPKESFAKNLMGCFASLFFIALAVGCCGGLIGLSNQAEEKRAMQAMARLQVVIDENGGEFKILHSYPAYNNKGHFMNHVIVAEGVKNQKRIEAPSKPSLPVPGEIWQVEIIRNNCGIRYECVKKVR